MFLVLGVHPRYDVGEPVLARRRRLVLAGGLSCLSIGLFFVVEEVLEHMAGDVRKKLNREATALFATARIWDDGIIDPRDTREVLSFCLATCIEARRRTLHPSTFGVARG